MKRLSTWAHRARFRCVTWLSQKPGLYYGARRLSKRTDPLCIRPDTDLVIEGFPRSANSTTTYGFLALQEGSLHVAHHKHHAAQIIRAADWGIPAVVLIRAPREACLSLLALAAEARERVGKTNADGLTYSDVLKAYIAFYEAVEPRLADVVIAPFETVTHDLTGLVERINKRFGTDFQAHARRPGPRSELGWHAMPNKIRDRIKRDLEDQFETELYASSSLRRLLRRAAAVHAHYGEAYESTR